MARGVLGHGFKLLEVDPYLSCPLYQHEKHQRMLSPPWLMLEEEIGEMIQYEST